MVVAGGGAEVLRERPPSVDRFGVDPPFISVLITCHRRRTFVREALASVRAQQYPAHSFETIVTAAVPPAGLDEEPASDRVRYVQVDADRYGTELAVAVRASRGQILCLLDDDDLFEPGKLERVAELFQTDRTLGFFSNNFTVADATGRELPDHPFRRGTRRARQSVGSVRLEGPHALRDLIRYAPLAPDFNQSCVSVRRELVDPILPQLERVPLAADTFLFYAAIMAGVGIRIGSETLTRYRLHSGNVSNAGPGEAGRVLVKLHGHAEATAASYRVTRELVNGGPAEAVGALEELINMQRLYATLRNPQTDRRSMWDAIKQAFRNRDSYTWRNERVVTPLAALYVVSPRVAQWAYLRLKGRELST